MTLRLLANSILTRQKPAEILPGKQQRVFGQYQGRISMSEDFDEPLPDTLISTRCRESQLVYLKSQP